jgi:hypothetical protein
MPAATNTVEAYERLRAAVLGAEPVSGRDLSTVRHRGLASWLKNLDPQPHAAPDHARWALMQGTIPHPAPAANELTRLIAGLVVALAAEPAHA